MSKLLLDTHTVFWFFWDDPRLSTNAKSLIEDPENQKLVSTASCWEIAIKSVTSSTWASVFQVGITIVHDEPRSNRRAELA